MGIISNLHREMAETLEHQHFASYQMWESKASSWLTSHIDYRSDRFRAICFDAKGRQCLQGADFMRARDDDSFPVYWLWPDQIAWLGASLVGEGKEIAWPPASSTALPSATITQAEG